VWAIVDTDRLNEIEYFSIVGTGHPLADKKPKFVHYLGTVQQDDGYLIWHVFRSVK
jgi:poly(3-hydroxybutyrate) depolymerase